MRVGSGSCSGASRGESVIGKDCGVDGAAIEEIACILAVSFLIYFELRENPKTPLAKQRDPDFTERMIRPGFLDIESRQNLIELARDGWAAHRLARRANALVLLDDG